MDQMKDVYIVQCLMETDLYKLLKTQVSCIFKINCIKIMCVKHNSIKVVILGRLSLNTGKQKKCYVVATRKMIL